MRAITLESFEDAPGLREVPKPEIAADEVLVRVHASSVNGFDGAVATLMAKEYYEYEFPVTLGAEATVDADALSLTIDEPALLNS